MSSGDFAFGCGCFSFAADCRTPGSGGSCPHHRGKAWTYAAVWEANRRNPEWEKKNWGAADRPYDFTKHRHMTDKELATELAKAQ